ncbi:MAG: hypothetical protein LBT80_02880 [Lactobacillaceae bacterium]|nr:hypothetical protein [Lactobacillaceae bacterium]
MKRERKIVDPATGLVIWHPFIDNADYLLCQLEKRYAFIDVGHRYHHLGKVQPEE